MSSCDNYYGFKLPDEINDKLHDNLKQYLQMKEDGQDTSLLLRDINFQYKILQCKDFCKSNAGYIYCQYNERDIS